MKQLITFLAAVMICSAATAQTDTTVNKKSDTIRIGGIIIVKKGKNKNDKNVNITMGRKDKQKKHRRVFFTSRNIFKRMNDHKKNAGIYCKLPVKRLCWQYYTLNHRNHSAIRKIQ